jgi:hypothetical protein
VDVMDRLYPGRGSYLENKKMTETIFLGEK